MRAPGHVTDDAYSRVSEFRRHGYGLRWTRRFVGGAGLRNHLSKVLRKVGPKGSFVVGAIVAPDRALAPKYSRSLHQLRRPLTVLQGVPELMRTTRDRESSRDC